MIVILDLDYTLLDTAALKRALEESMLPLGVASAQFQETYSATAQATPGKYDYSIKGHARLLHERFGIDEAAALARLTSALDMLPSALYPDSAPFLEALTHERIPMALLTLGNPRFQEEKVAKLGIAKHFSHLFFTDGSKAEIRLDLPEPSGEWVFINDNPAELRDLSVRYPDAAMIRIRRPGGKEFPPDEEALEFPRISLLGEAKPMIGL